MQRIVRSGTVWTQQAKLIASDPAANDEFGVSIGVSGDTAVIGARTDDHAGGTDAGSAYAFVRTGPPGSQVWTQQDKMIAADTAANVQFGYSVAASGDTAVIGAWLAGKAYVFVRTGPIGSQVWTQQRMLIASDAAGSDFFGFTVAISIDTAVVGAYGDDHEGGFDAGSAYVFDVNCEPACPADIAPSGGGNGEVDIDDLFAVIAAWGPCNGCPPADCIEDLDDDCDVDIDDLFAVIAAWGPCP